MMRKWKVVVGSLGMLIALLYSGHVQQIVKTKIQWLRTKIKGSSY